MIICHLGTWRLRNGPDEAQPQRGAANGVIKPAPAIDQILFERYDLAPQDRIFIDVSAKNIEAARAVGMQGIHVVEPIDPRGMRSRELSVGCARNARAAPESAGGLHGA